MPNVRSSMMTRVDYDDSAMELDITFTGGKTYRYFEVPAETCYDLLDAESQGEFFNEHIRDKFRYSEVASRRRQPR